MNVYFINTAMFTTLNVIYSVKMKILWNEQNASMKNESMNIWKAEIFRVQKVKWMISGRNLQR